MENKKDCQDKEDWDEVCFGRSLKWLWGHSGVSNRKLDVGFRSLGNKARLKIKILGSSSTEVYANTQEMSIQRNKE